MSIRDKDNQSGTSGQASTETELDWINNNGSAQGWNHQRFINVQLVIWKLQRETTFNSDGTLSATTFSGSGHSNKSIIYRFLI